MTRTISVTMTDPLPPIALSVRQPWAWAILHAGKDVENRSLASIRAGRMVPGRIALHAAKGMTRDEYTWALGKLSDRGVICPPPAELPRGAIIGSVTVTEVIDRSDSPWFGGAAGLLLANPVPCPPVPAVGALGYFRWTPGTRLARPLPWMQNYSDPTTESLFSELPIQFRNPPKGPLARKRNQNPKN